MTSSSPMSREQVRDVDRRAMVEFGLSGLVLMENAGRGCADWLLNEGVKGRVIICCGKGNNGGDGYVIARHLEAAGVDVEVLLFTNPDELAGDSETNFAVLAKAGTPFIRAADLDDAAFQERLRESEWIIDALLGTGITGEVREPSASAIRAINESGKPVLAVALPSGMDCDTGQSLGVCVRATQTVTFVARKIGFDAEGAVSLTGLVKVLPIGVPRQLLDPD
ncbi:MAG: NAD(P)H-hydrate epimerase [Verrucomicrobiaceae bacterium]|nr:NAD(P)H-hydrate epimerase [Verrucomicrobiaceae bacterium]